MSLYNLLARRVLAPAYDLTRGTHTMRCLRELERSQWWPPERIHELQSARLQRLIEHAYLNVPHYRRVMNERGVVPTDIRTPADLVPLPVLTRPFVQEHRDDMVAEGSQRDRLRATKTSGSTGTPLLFYSTQRDQLDHGFARSIRALEWAGLRLGDRTAVLGRPRLQVGTRERLLKPLSRRFQRTVPVYVDRLTNSAMPEVVRWLGEAGIHGIRGYPSAIALLAGFIKDTGATAPAIRSILTGGAELLSHDRRLIREVFATEPHSDYSAYECFEIASECSAHEGLHISAEDVVVEVLDEAGSPVPPGVEGRIVVTNLHNYATPFIRYDLGDSGMMLGGSCPCGRTLPRLASLIGRKNEVFITRSGKPVFSEMLFLDRLAGLGMRQYQIVRQTEDAAVMWLVAPPEASSDLERERLKNEVLAMFQSKFGADLILNVEFVDRIEPTAAGKHVFMLSDLAGD